MIQVEQLSIDQYFDQQEQQLKPLLVEVYKQYQQNKKVKSLLELVSEKIIEEIEDTVLIISKVQQLYSKDQTKLNVDQQDKIEVINIKEIKDHKEYVRVQKDIEQRQLYLNSKQNRKMVREKQEEQRVIKENEVEDKRLQREQEEMRLLKVQKAEKVLQELQERKQQRSQQIKRANEFYKEQQKPLYVIKQEASVKEVNYHFNRVMKADDILHNRKLQLEQIRDLRQPISRQQILEHQQRIAAMTKSIEQNKSVEQNRTQPIYHHSDAYLKAERERSQKMEEEEERKRIKSELQEKKAKLAQNIKQNYPPTVSEDKKNDLLTLQTKLHHQVDFRAYLKRNNKFLNQDIQLSSSIIIADPKEIGKQYLQYARLKRKMNFNDGSLGESSPMRETFRIGSTEPQFKVKKNNTIPDYLKEMRAKRPPNKDIIHNWERVAASSQMDQGSKNQRILTEVQKLENAAQRQERLYKVGAVDVHDDADDYLIGSIKAKLSILG